MSFLKSSHFLLKRYGTNQVKFRGPARVPFLNLLTGHCV